MHHDMEEAAPPQEIVRALVAHKEQFLRFLERRTGSREVAEEVLQAAFVKGLERGETIRATESTVAWAYRMLRNALVDRHRRRDAEARAMVRYAEEAVTPAEEPELHSAICRCMSGLIPTLRPDQAELLRRVELDGVQVSDVANELGITANNAAVRLHRARQSLRKRLEQTCGACTEHGCLDCTCHD